MVVGYTGAKNGTNIPSKNVIDSESRVATNLEGFGLILEAKKPSKNNVEIERIFGDRRRAPRPGPGGGRGPPATYRHGNFRKAPGLGVVPKCCSRWPERRRESVWDPLGDSWDQKRAKLIQNGPKMEPQWCS